MDTESTVDLLMKDLDEEVGNNSIVDAMDTHALNMIVPEHPLNLLGNKSDISLNSVKRMDTNQCDDNNSETSTNIDANRIMDLAPHSSMFTKNEASFTTPDLKTSATETMSGQTFTDNSNQVYINMSPSTSTERLKKMLENDNKDIEHESMIKKKPTAPRSFVLESTKPLLPYQNENAETNSIIHVETTSDTEYDNGYDAFFNQQNQQSPKIRHSPAKIPLTNIMTINNFVKIPNESMKPTRRPSESLTYNNITKNLLNNNSDSNTYEMDRRSPSIPSTPEMNSLKSNEIHECNDFRLSNNFNTRIFSMATTIGDYQSAKEHQSESELISQNDINSQEQTEYDMVNTLNISSGLEAHDETFEMLTDGTLHGSMQQFNIDFDSENDNTDSINDAESISAILLNSNQESEYTNKKIEQTRTKIKNIIHAESEILSKESQKFLNPTNLKADAISTESVNTLTTNMVKDLIIDSSSDSSRVSSPNERSTLRSSSGGSNTDFDPNTISFDNAKGEVVQQVIDEKQNDRNSPKLGNEKEVKNVYGPSKSQEPRAFQVLLNDPIDQVSKPEQNLNDQNIEDVSGNSIALKAKPTTHGFRTLSDNSESRSINSDLSSRIPSNILPIIEKFEALHIDSPNEIEGGNSFDSDESENVYNPKNYLSVWHIQESSRPYSPTLSSEAKKLKAPESITHRVSSYSFKPTIVHRPKIHYPVTDEIFKQTENKGLLDEVPITQSLSEEFEYLFRGISADVVSINDVNTSPAGPFNIWNNDDSILANSVTIDNMNIQQNSMSIEHAIGGEIGAMKSQVKNVIVRKADSVKSYNIGSDDEIFVAEIQTPKRASDVTEYRMNNLFHIDSPVKLINREKEPHDSKLYSSNPFISSYGKFVGTKKHIIIPNEPKPSMRKITTEAPETELQAAVPTTNSNESADTCDIIAALIKQKVSNDFIPTEKGSVDTGILYLYLKKIKVELDGISYHQAKFSVEVDNGINVTKTPWKPLSEDLCLNIERELEIPIRSLDQRIFLTLRCRFTRPKYELFEVMEKVRVGGKKYGAFGKSTYKYEKKFKQRPIENDDWDYIFAPDGSCGRLEIPLNETFLNDNEFKESKDICLDLVNKWASIRPTTNQSDMNDKLVKRKPYKIGSISLNACYLKRTSSFERFPKTLKLVNDMVNKLKLKNSITKEGFLLQEGGDIQGPLQKRYFKLTGSSLVGYHEVSRKPKVNINLLKAVDVIDNNDFKRPGGRDFTNLILFGESFKVIFDDGEVISFSSDTSTDETRDWYNKMKESLALNIVHQPWVKEMIKNEH